MAEVVITEEFEKEINKRFKEESVRIFKLLYTLVHSPKKGKAVGSVGDIVVKELKYKVYRFYFITDGFKVKFLKGSQLADLLIKFVRMSDKKGQQHVLDDIRRTLRLLGGDGFG